MPDPFADIRPFNDDEVPSVLQRLSQSEVLPAAILKYRYPRLPLWLNRLLRPLAAGAIRRRSRDIHGVEDFQHWVSDWVATLLQQSAAKVEVRGLEQLQKGQSYLWISNHRDIAMDPTMINFSLHQADWPTSRIAIGDNLLRHPDVSDIMRLNKSFIVKRSVANKREKLRELQKLSAYIRTSLDDGHSIWIAQREGRAKDGVDVTDTAVLKMLALNGRERGEDFTQTMLAMRPVPVSIQYEWDPCDADKARELVIRRESGRYDKTDDEDTRSILRGLTGYKGRIFVDFGQPLSAEELASAETMAEAIDRQLCRMTEIMPVHKAAFDLLQERFAAWPAASSAGSDAATRMELAQRIENLSSEIQQRLLTTYAVPYLTSQGLME